MRSYLRKPYVDPEVMYSGIKRLYSDGAVVVQQRAKSRSLRGEVVGVDMYGRPFNMALAPAVRKAVATKRAGVYRKSGFYGRFSGPNAELKFLDTALSFNIDRTLEVPATGQLALIPQGQTESTRVGRSCTIRSVEIKGVINMTGAATPDDVVSIYLIMDTQTNGAAAAATDVFTSTDGPIALRNLEKSTRFTILKKWVFNMNAQAGVAAAYGAMARNIQYYRKCNIPMLYDSSASTGALTTITTNNLFLMAGSYLADDQCTFAGNCRIRFSDS